MKLVMNPFKTDVGLTPEPSRHRHSQRRQSLRAVLGATLCLVRVAAWAQPTPAGMAMGKVVGKVVLTVKGNVTKPNKGADAEFDMHMLESLPQVSHSVDTPWYPRKVTFRGPLLRDVLAAAGATGKTVKAVAINDYAVDIPFSDAIQHDVILAVQMNGKAMSPRDKGPLFVIYPYGKFAANEVKYYHDLSVWQLDTLEVK